MLNQPDKLRVERYKTNNKNLRQPALSLTLDTPDDLERLLKLYQACGGSFPSLVDILAKIEELKWDQFMKKVALQSNIVGSMRHKRHVKKQKMVKVPTVSVIVPVFNEEKIFGAGFMPHFVKSRTADYEIIAVDDASTDNSLKCIEQFKSNVELIQNETNSGLPLA